MDKQKRLVAINDISGFGKCSLTVALPIISACGVETVCMPTAVLSTHTGGFTGYTYRDLTEDMVPVMNHWSSLDIKFDAIYSGFLGSKDQIAIVKDFVDTFRTPDNIVIVDPAMADYGKMYAIFDMDFAEKMALLCAKADIILPNITEAAFMVGEEYVEGVLTEEYVDRLITKLLDMGAGSVVLTGVSFEESKLGAACRGKGESKTQYCFSERLEGSFHGTGDVFASSFCGALMNGFTIADAMAVAVSYTCDCIIRTKAVDDDVRYGVDFERGIPYLLKEQVLLPASAGILI